jgi:signal transduction histidine kinase
MEIHNLLNKAIEFTKTSFQNRNVDLQVESSVKKLYGQVNDFIVDIFENLLINSVHHNDQPSINITVNLSKDQMEDKKYIKMEFKDNGIGISDFRKKTIFLRGTKRDQRSKGMGLGLSLVKKIIDSFKGSIWVEDRIKGDYKQGSNFIVLIPEAN